ncbi:MAG: molybdenum cofactor guanylyltransferase [Candidatus Dormibacteria bacterium]
MELGLLILAGGRSLRMGRDKPGIPFPDPGDPPLIHRVATAIGGLAGPPLIAGPSDYGTGWQVVPDEQGIEGPVSGLLAGLEALQTSLVLVLGADAPFPSVRLARGLYRIAGREPQAEAVVPEREGRLEPLFAIYRAGASHGLREMARQLGQPGRGPSLRQTLPGLRLRTVAEPEWRVWDPSGISFLNCNTPEQLAVAAAMARAQPDRGGNQ